MTKVDRKIASSDTTKVNVGHGLFSSASIHTAKIVAIFAVWMLALEKSPWPTLTLVVSLEAIFLSTFVMIGQNRQAAFQQAKANHDFAVNEQELHLNTDLTKAIHTMTEQLHQRL